MKKIKLTQGQYALVDDADFEWLNQWKWQIVKGWNTYYATRHNAPISRKSIKMHRLILNFPKNKQIDHIDGNGLNNQKKNLRICTRSQNGINRGLQKNNTSGYKGVHLHKISRKWQASIRINNKSIYLGIFDSKKEAKMAYEKAAKKLHGEFRRIT